MAQERQGYAAYLRQDPTLQQQTLINILNTYPNRSVNDWTVDEAEIILGLHEAGKLKEAIEQPAVVSGVQKITEVNPDTTTQVKIHPAIVTFAHGLLEGERSTTLQALAAKYPRKTATPSVYPAPPSYSAASGRGTINGDGRASVAAALLPASSPAPATFQQKKYLASFARGTANLLWTKRNPGQRVAMYGLAAPAVAFAVAGALTTKSATLTTVGTAMGKILPGFITAFGASHAIPPAAIAFYVLAATLAAAALVLFIASSLHRCAQNGKYKPLADAAFQPHPRHAASAGVV